MYNIIDLLVNIYQQEWNISMFFVIGGNGSHAGATAIYEQVYTHIYILHISPPGYIKIYKSNLELTSTMPAQYHLYIYIYSVY